jgi:hypothetical protein
MKVKELIEKLQKVDGEKDVFVSPIVEMRLFGDNVAENTTALTPNPAELYPIAMVREAGSVGAGGVYNLHLVLGFDDSINHGIELISPPEAEEGDEFVN